MARIAFLIKQPKRALGALAVLVAATGVVIGSGANFTASSANPSNTFSAGILSMSNSAAPGAILGATGLKPGVTTTGTVDIQNTGTIAGDFTLRRSALTNTDATNPMAAVLQLVVKDCGEWPAPGTPEPCGDGDDVTRVTSSLAGMGTGNHPLTNFSANEKHTFEFSVTLDATAGDVYENGGSTAEFTWDATQS